MSCGFLNSSETLVTFDEPETLLYCPEGKKMGRKSELTFVDSSSVRYLANDDNNNDDGNYFTY